MSDSFFRDLLVKYERYLDNRSDTNIYFTSPEVSELCRLGVAPSTTALPQRDTESDDPADDASG